MIRRNTGKHGIVSVYFVKGNKEWIDANRAFKITNAIFDNIGNSNTGSPSCYEEYKYLMSRFLMPNSLISIQ